MRLVEACHTIPYPWIFKLILISFPRRESVSGAGLLGATLPDVARALTVVSKACGLDMSKSKEITEGAHRKPIHLMCIYI
jgi:hypothetical protein